MQRQHKLCFLNQRTAPPLQGACQIFWDFLANICVVLYVLVDFNIRIGPDHLYLFSTMFRFPLRARFLCGTLYFDSSCEYIHGEI